MTAPRPGTTRLSFLIGAAVAAASTIGLGWLTLAPCGAWILETGLRAGVIQ